MLDYVIRSGTVIDGTGGPARQADVGIARRPDRRHRRRSTRPGPTEFDATGLIVVPGHRGPPHPLRRPALLGPVGLALQPARRHHGHRGELRLHAGPDQPRGRRLHPPHDGQGRGHAPGRARAGRAVDLVDLRRVPGALEGNLGVNAGFLVGHCALRRKVMGADAGRRGGHRRRRSPPCAPSWPSRWRPAVSGSRPRSRAPTPTATAARSPRATPIAARCWRSARRWRPTRARRSSTSPTAASMPSATRRSTS